MGGGSKGTPTNRPLSSQENSLLASQTDLNKQAVNMALESANRSAKSQADWEAYYRDTEIGANDPNSQLYAATVAGNDSNQAATSGYNAAINSLAGSYSGASSDLASGFNSEMRGLASRYGNESLSNAKETANTINGYANEYNNFMGGIDKSIGTADEGILGRLRANNLSGLSTANNNASRSLQAQLAQRGMLNSGIGAKSMTDLNSNYMNSLSGTLANTYGQAIKDSDAMRGNRVDLNTQRLNGMIGASSSAGQGIGSALDKQFSSMSDAMKSGYQANSGALQSGYNAQNSALGGSLAALSGMNQQRISNLTNYAQLGRGMAGISSNYLGQAGTGFSNASNSAGNAFNSITGLNNNYANAQSAAKGQAMSGLGSLAGSLGGAAIMASSDKRLKDNITQIGTVGELNLYIWTWNDEAVRIGANHAPAIGVIAQEVQELYPDAVGEIQEGYLGVDYNKVIAYAKESK